MFSNLGTAGLYAWPYTWPRSSQLMQFGAAMMLSGWKYCRTRMGSVSQISGRIVVEGRLRRLLQHFLRDQSGSYVLVVALMVRRGGGWRRGVDRGPRATPARQPSTLRFVTQDPTRTSRVRSTWGRCHFSLATRSRGAEGSFAAGRLRNDTQRRSSQERAAASAAAFRHRH
jgi:hypothetical protein